PRGRLGQLALGAVQIRDLRGQPLFSLARVRDGGSRRVRDARRFQVPCGQLTRCLVRAAPVVDLAPRSACAIPRALRFLEYADRLVQLGLRAVALRLQRGDQLPPLGERGLGVRPVERGAVLDDVAQRVLRVEQPLAALVQLRERTAQPAELRGRERRAAEYVEPVGQRLPRRGGTLELGTGAPRRLACALQLRELRGEVGLVEQKRVGEQVAQGGGALRKPCRVCPRAPGGCIELLDRRGDVVQFRGSGFQLRGWIARGERRELAREQRRVAPAGLGLCEPRLVFADAGAQLLRPAAQLGDQPLPRLASERGPLGHPRPAHDAFLLDRHVRARPRPGAVRLRDIAEAAGLDEPYGVQLAL